VPTRPAQPDGTASASLSGPAAERRRIAASKLTGPPPRPGLDARIGDSLDAIERRSRRSSCRGWWTPASRAASQNERDHATLQAAVAAGRVATQTGV
jgi:hypothetical protein